MTMKKFFIMFTAGVVLAAAVWAEPDVYLAGYAKNVGACYWKNGILTVLTNGRTEAGPRAIVVSGNDVYIAGYDGDVACYWKNGIKTAITDSSTASQPGHGGIALGGGGKANRLTPRAYGGELDMLRVG
jgi:hypothetical protein